MSKIILPIMLFAIICMGIASARQGHLVLLAVHQEDGQQTGATADLELEIKQGTGNVYLNTVPLTRIDTQISTRFAKDIACSYLNIDCTGYDFFYTIKADSSIIGGPSAGAATAALTVFLLADVKYDPLVMVTGTINSGGIVGPIGGLKAKLQAAGQTKGAEKVLIPLGESYIQEGNQTIDAVEYGKNLSLQVEEVATIDDVVFQFTGKHLKTPEKNLTIDPNYLGTMRRLSSELCNRTSALSVTVEQDADLATRLGKSYKANFEVARNLSNRGIKALENSFYYAAASYCFGANVRLQEILQGMKNRTELLKAINETQQQTIKMEKDLNETKLETLTDLQAYIVTSERLNEAEEQLKLARTENTSKENYLAYAIERLQSAQSWSTFFGQSGKKFVFNQEVLKESCLQKIAEAEESYQYVTLYFPSLLQSTSEDIAEAYRFVEKKQYGLCLSKAANAKANANSVLSVIGIKEDQVGTLIDEKLSIGKQLIITQSQENSFPILAYSYWEYAVSLKPYDKYSSLLYAEYALELSNLDIYFKHKQPGIFVEIDPAFYWVFALGLFVGISVGWGIRRGRTGKKKAKRKRVKN